MEIRKYDNGSQFILTNKNDVCEFENNADEKITDLCLTSNKFKTDLSILKSYPNLKHLTLIGNFDCFEFIQNLEHLETLILYLNNAEYLDYEELMTDKLSRLDIHDSRKISDLSFIEKAKNLKKLFLCSLPKVTALPKLSEIYFLKIYELHKVTNIDSLINSKIQYLDLTIFADKISGTNIAKALTQMKEIKKAYIDLIDRGGRRDEVIKNYLKKFEMSFLTDLSEPPDFKLL